MTHGQAMITIVLPQAFRIVIPPLTNEIILLVKDSSLVYVLGVTTAQYELTKFSQDFLNRTREPHTAHRRRPAATSSSPSRCRSSCAALEKRYAKAR